MRSHNINKTTKTIKRKNNHAPRVRKSIYIYCHTSSLQMITTLGKIKKAQQYTNRHLHLDPDHLTRFASAIPKINHVNLPQKID